MAASCSSKFDPIPDALWERMEPVFPIYKRSCQGGRPRLAPRNVVTGIVDVLRTGGQWKALPKVFGSGSALHADFQEWVERRVFHKRWRRALPESDDLTGIDWQWQCWDGAMTKSPRGGKKTGRNPTARGKLGVQRSVLTDGRGVPLGIAIAGANVPDQKLVMETFQSLPVHRPAPRPRQRQPLCADKGDDAKSLRSAAARRRYVVHIPHTGEHAQRSPRRTARARRGVVERTHSGTNRARRLLIRREKKAANDLALLHLQFALTTWRVAGVLG